MPIGKNIRKNYLRKLLRSLLFLALLLLFWVFSPFLQFFFPVQVSSGQPDKSLDKSTRYASFENVSLHYTGYCHKQRGKAKGYYYYSFIGEDCFFFLLKNSTCSNGQETLTLKNVRGAVASGTSAEKMLIAGLSEDLDWNSAELSKITKPFLIVEKDYHLILGAFTYGLLFLITLLTFFSACLSIIYIGRPALSPFCGSLLSPVNSGRRLLRAQKELADYCLVRGGSFYITRHYIIELTKNSTHILPLKSLAWVYEHSGSASFLGHRRKVRYIITYYNKRKHAVHSVYENHDDVDTILSYLRDYYPEILNGYTPENQALFKEL